MPTRDDPRYVRQRDARAILHAWAGPEFTMPMGGWTDGDEAAFEEAIRDELRFALLPEEAKATDFEIHRIRRDTDGHVVCCHGE